MKTNARSISFEDTEIAFKSKSDQDLKQAYWLFKLISSNLLTTIGPPIANFSLKIGLPVKGLIRKTIFKHFCGGETILDCQKSIATLSSRGVGTILDYSVEGEEIETVFDATYEEILKTIVFAADHPEQIPFSVFKPTGVGRFELYAKINARHSLTERESAEFERAKARINGICRLAHEKGVKVLIDAEHSWVQDVFDDIAREMMELYNKEKPIVFNTYQLYRHDKLASLKADFAYAGVQGFFLGAKIVRGAYMEIERDRAVEKGYPSPIQPTKDASDRDYDLAILFCLDQLDKIAFMAGTHNEESSLMLVNEMTVRQIPSDHPHIYFAQLLGMSDNLTFNLAEHGYNVAKYMPYGEIRYVMPYLFRRAQENTSVAGQSSRELLLLKKEIKRRGI